MLRKMGPQAVEWLEEMYDVENHTLFKPHYKKFRFNKMVGEVGDFVLISNADAADPDTEEGCDIAKIIALYEDVCNECDPFMAKVQWYSRPNNMPKWCFNNIEPINFFEKEVLEDHRPFHCDVSIETFFKKCSITFAHTKDTDDILKNKPVYHYICRYRVLPVSKRKVHIEPVLEKERRALQVLCTPTKNVLTPVPRTPKTPNSVVKMFDSMSIVESNNWSVSRNEGTKVLLKRAIDKGKTASPKRITPKSTPKSISKVTETPKSSKKCSNKHIEEILSMELKENSDEEALPTLIRSTPKSTPKSISKITETPKSSKKCNNKNIEEILSMELKENSDEEELPTLIIRQLVSEPSKQSESPTKTTHRTPRRALDFDNYNNKTNSRSTKKLESPIQTPKYSSSEVQNFNNESKNNETYCTRSGRVTRHPGKYLDDGPSPNKKAKKCISMTEDDDDFKPALKTPRTPRTPKTFRDVTRTPRTPKTFRDVTRTPRTSTARTPKGSAKKRIAVSQLTPKLQSRSHSIDDDDMFIRNNELLPGREQQMEEILSYVRDKILNGTSGCMYISGMPGTGKTATICAALEILKKEPDLPDFQVVEINGMRLSEPRQAYVQIYQQLTGKKVVWAQACTLLMKRFTELRPRRTPTVLLVDELDALYTRRQDVIYSIMDWAAHNSAQLTVLAVANTMNLPERGLASRVSSRLGLTRLTFPSYNHSQLQQIVTSKLAKSNVTSDAIQLIARKVASVSGDARRALELCSRALELADPTGGGAGLAHVQRALDETASSITVRIIRSCSPAQKLILKAVAAEVESTGLEETVLSRVLANASVFVALDGLPYKSATSVRAPTPSQTLEICAALASMRLLLLERMPAEPKIILNVSVDDIHYGTRQITV